MRRESKRRGGGERLSYGFYRHKAMETTALCMAGTTAFGKLGDLLGTSDKEEKNNTQRGPAHSCRRGPVVQ